METAWISIIAFSLLINLLFSLFLRSLLFKKTTPTSASADLSLEKARFESAINSIHVGFIITNNNGEVVSINTAAKSILCLKRHVTVEFNHIDPSIVNLSCNMADLEKELEGFFDIKQQIQRCLTEKKSINIDEINFRDLILKIFITPVVLVKNESNLELDFIGAVILVEDITDTKIAERSKVEFFSIASHELKTPLAVIKGNTEIIKKYFHTSLSDPKLKIMIDDIHKSSIRLVGIVDDFLNLSRLEQGKIIFQQEKFDLLKLTEEVVFELSNMALSKGLSLKFEDGQGSCFVYGDREKSREVLTNLIDNAIKFTKVGGVTVSISIGDGVWRVVVKDTGRGISSAHQHLLFKKFQQASFESLTRDTQRSTGVGLYITKLLAEGMGGEVRLVSSFEGVGSEFAFSLKKAQ